MEYFLPELHLLFYTILQHSSKVADCSLDDQEHQPLMLAEDQAPC